MLQDDDFQTGGCLDVANTLIGVSRGRTLRINIALLCIRHLGILIPRASLAVSADISSRGHGVLALVTILLRAAHIADIGRQSGGRAVGTTLWIVIWSRGI